MNTFSIIYLLGVRTLSLCKMYYVWISNKCILTAKLLNNRSSLYLWVIELTNWSLASLMYFKSQV